MCSLDFDRKYISRGQIRSVEAVWCNLRFLAASCLGHSLVVFVLFANISLYIFRNLRGSCNVMIAVEAFCEIIHQSGHIFTAYYIYRGEYFITTEQCFILQAIPNFFMNVGSCLNLCIGVDRLFSILFPLL